MELSVRIERVKDSIKARLSEATHEEDDKKITLYNEMLRDIKTLVLDVGEKLTDIEKKVGITPEKKGKPGVSKAAPPAPVVPTVAVTPEVKEEPKASEEIKPKKGKGKTTDKGKKKEPFLRHLWSENDDIITLYLYKFNADQLPYTLDQVVEKLGVTIGSFKMRRNNFKFLDGKGGLQNFSEQSRKIYEDYKSKTEEELRKIVLDLLK